MLRFLVLWLSLAALPWSLSCSATESFVCDADVQCVTESEIGRCEPNGSCSFPDETCPSGHRYGEHAGEHVGECVEAGSTDVATDPGATSIGPESTAGPGDDSSGPSATSTTSTSTSSTTDPNSETTGTTDRTPYGPCMAAVDCAVSGSSCLPTLSGGSVCSPPCDVEPCNDDGMAAATVACLPVAGEFQGCILLCDTPEECPGGMVCEEIMGAGLGYCVWPVR